MTPEIRHNPLNLHERLSLILSGASEPASPSLTGRQLRVDLLRRATPCTSHPGRTALQARGSRGSPPLRPPVTEDSHIPKGRRASSPRRSCTCYCGRPVPGDRASPARGPSSMLGRAAACALAHSVWGPPHLPMCSVPFSTPAPAPLCPFPARREKAAPARLSCSSFLSHLPAPRCRRAESSPRTSMMLGARPLSLPRSPAVPGCQDPVP
ncbi:uncharacterized protein LOC144223520 isoform X2 [Crocuta crocuta]